MRDPYIALPEKTSGCHFNFLCNLVYADCGLDQTYGYYRTDQLTGMSKGKSEGGYCCGIPCIVEMRCGDITTKYPSLTDKLYSANEGDEDAEERLAGKTVTRAGVLCCIGGSSVRERYGLFSVRRTELTLPRETPSVLNAPFGMK